MSIGSRLTELRSEKGLTRVQLAEELNIPMTTLRNYEQDQREPGHKFLLEASRYFGVTTDYILENEKAPAPEMQAQENPSWVPPAQVTTPQEQQVAPQKKPVLTQRSPVVNKPASVPEPVRISSEKIHTQPPAPVALAHF